LEKNKHQYTNEEVKSCKRIVFLKSYMANLGINSLMYEYKCV
jgi:hypothetical protein